jgi:hypothetical protein
MKKFAFETEIYVCRSDKLEQLKYNILTTINHIYSTATASMKPAVILLPKLPGTRTQYYFIGK